MEGGEAVSSVRNECSMCVRMCVLLISDGLVIYLVCV